MNQNYRVFVAALLHQPIHPPSIGFPSVADQFTLTTLLLSFFHIYLKDYRSCGSNQARRWSFGILTLLVLSTAVHAAKVRDTHTSGNGEEVTKVAKQYRMHVVSGLTFAAPVSHKTSPLGRSEGFDIRLVWPNIPPGKAPKTKPQKSPSNAVGDRTTNTVVVQVRPRKDGVEDIDQYERLEKEGFWTSADNVERLDSALQLRMFSARKTPNTILYAYSTAPELVTPLHHLPVVIASGAYMNFVYAPNIHVRINMLGWGSRVINPNWSDIFLGVVETLNQYRKNRGRACITA